MYETAVSIPSKLMMEATYLSQKKSRGGIILVSDLETRKIAESETNVIAKQYKTYQSRETYPCLPEKRPRNAEIRT
jgi:hypothetical protein